MRKKVKRQKMRNKKDGKREKVPLKSAGNMDKMHNVCVECREESNKICKMAMLRLDVQCMIVYNYTTVVKSDSGGKKHEEKRHQRDRTEIESAYQPAGAGYF